MTDKRKFKHGVPCTPLDNLPEQPWKRPSCCSAIESAQAVIAKNQAILDDPTKSEAVKARAREIIAIQQAIIDSKTY